jgi:DNA transposition AAA+ family ATPase
MTKPDKNPELKKAINDYCRRRGISKNELSAETGINSAYLSRIENERFEEISDEALIKIRSEISMRTVPEVFETGDLKSVFHQCETTRRNRLMTGLAGDTGTGKTTSLRAYSMRKNVFYVTVDKTMNAKRFSISILKSMGISFDGNIYDVMEKTAEELNRIESPLLIIDEAGKLNHAMILYLHDLREHTRFNCGILLSGMPYFKKNLEKFSEKQKEGYAEFLRRINIWHELKGLSRNEIDVICDENGICGDHRVYYGLRFADLMNKILLEKIANDEREESTRESDTKGFDYTENPFGTLRTGKAEQMQVVGI